MAQTAVVRELLVSLGFVADKNSKREASEFEKQIDRIKGSMQKASDAFGAAANKIASIGKVFAVAGGAIAAYNGLLIANSIAVAENAKQVERQSNLLGLTTDAYQEIRAVLGAYGVDARDLTDIFAQMVQKSSEAQRGGKEAALAFRGLGIEVSELKGLNPEQLFTRIAQGVSTLTDSNQKIDILSRILGEEAFKQAGPALVEGAEALAAFRKQFASSGGVLDKTDLQNAKQFNQSFTELKLRLQAVATEFGARMLPVLTQVFDRFNKWLDANKEGINAGIERWVTRIGEAYEWLGDKLEEADRIVQEKLGGWVNVIEKVLIAITALGGLFVVFQATSAFGLAIIGLTALFDALAAAAAFVGVATGPFIALVAAGAVAIAAYAAEIAALLLFFEDLYTYFQGGDSLIGRFIERFQTADGVTGALARAFKYATQASKDVYNALSIIAAKVRDFIWVTLRLGDVVGWVFKGLAIVFKLAFDDMIQRMTLFLGYFGKVAQGVSSVANWISGENQEFAGAGGLAFQQSMADPVISGIENNVSSTTNMGGNIFNNTFNTSANPEEIWKQISKQSSIAIQNNPSER